MDVLITGGAGTVGTAITDHLADREEYDVTSIDRKPHPDPNVESIEGDVTDRDHVLAAAEGKDALIHLAYVPLDVGHDTDRTIRWSEKHASTNKMAVNAFDAAVEAGVDSVVFASSNHAVGMYEVQNAPDIYFGDVDVTVDHTVPSRPDSMYGTGKVYGEGLGRLAAEAHDLSVYNLRICSVRPPEYDHPYGDAERGVDNGHFERDSEAYEEQVARQMCMWHSRRDLAHQVDCCLQDDSVDFDIFYGVSDNERRWFDIDHARETIGYDPQDSAEEWDGPPE
jgi:nucleoside-diphosphate-sugar epimerase